MKWFFREASLVTAVAAVIVVVQPSWLAMLARPWFAVVALLGAGAILSVVFARLPPEPLVVRSLPRSNLGEVRQMREIEQANDFLLAVDYQLYPFLQDAIRGIAAHRLLVRHNIGLDAQPDRARELVGDAAWQLVGPAHGSDGGRSWGTISPAQLATVTDALERL
jgi:hypothetical protein